MLLSSPCRRRQRGARRVPAEGSAGVGVHAVQQRHRPTRGHDADDFPVPLVRLLPRRGGRHRPMPQGAHLRLQRAGEKAKNDEGCNISVTTQKINFVIMAT